MSTCEYCNKTFKDEKSLGKHLVKSKNCQLRKHLIVYCQRCNETVKINQLKTHSCDMKDLASSEDLIKIVNERDELREKCKTLKASIKDSQSTINNIQTELRWERLQRSLFTHIIRNNTNIPIDTMIEHAEDGIHLYNYENGNIPVIVHSNLKGQRGKKKKYNLGRTTKVTKKIYRTVKNKIELAEEHPDLVEEQVKHVDDILEEEREKFESKDKILENIETLFETVQNSRVYTQSLQSMRSVRGQLLGQLSITEYTKLVQSQLKRLKSIFEGRDFKGKKLRKVVSSALSPLDMRLTFYGEFYNTTLDVDDVQTLKTALDINTPHSREYIPFDKQLLFEQFHNYSISLFPLKELIQRILINRYGFHNVMYLAMPKSTEQDPYSFYSLDAVTKGIRQWKMESRLEDLCIDFSDNVRGYCISLFRKIYSSVFNDNEYREDFQDRGQIMNEDVEQLIQNIQTLSQPIEFRDMMKEMVKNYATIQPTDMDKCHLTGDDQLQQRRFKNEVASEDSLVSAAIQMFDNINNTEALKFWHRRIIDTKS